MTAVPSPSTINKDVHLAYLRYNMRRCRQLSPCQVAVEQPWNDGVRWKSTFQEREKMLRFQENLPVLDLPYYHFSSGAEIVPRRWRSPFGGLPSPIGDTDAGSLFSAAYTLSTVDPHPDFHPGLNLFRILTFLFQQYQIASTLSILQHYLPQRQLYHKTFTIRCIPATRKQGFDAPPLSMLTDVSNIVRVTMRW